MKRPMGMRPQMMDEEEAPVPAPEGQTEVVEGDRGPAAAPEGGGGAGALKQASPEEMELYERFVGRAMEMINASWDQTIEMLRGGSEGGEEEQGPAGPARGLTSTAVTIIRRVEQMAEQGGQELPPDVVFAAGVEIFQQLAQMSNEAGISDYKTGDDTYEAAFFAAIEEYVQEELAAGKIDKAAAQQQMQQLQQMSESGELEQLLRSLDEHDRAGAQKQQPPAGKPQGMAPMMGA